MNQIYNSETMAKSFQGLNDFIALKAGGGGTDFKTILDVLQKDPQNILAQLANPKQKGLTIDGAEIKDKYSSEAMFAISFHFQKNEKILSMIMDLINFIKKLEEKAGGSS